MKTIKYWHDIPTQERNRIMDAGGLTWGELAKQYVQPDWCHYPHALAGQWGCWSLVGNMINKIQDCGDCEYCKPEPPAPPPESVKAQIGGRA